MRLLHSTTLRFEEFLGTSRPPYVILSHTWGPEEVSFQDMQESRATGKAGFHKIKGCCARAVQDGYDWVWVDTCCINKDSSAELSEAINSMYNWYKEAYLCYTYLSDVPTLFSVKDPVWEGIFDVKKVFRRSRWFSRGWTLQELLAPTIVEFYASDWTEVGTKSELKQVISDITGINIRALTGDDLSTFSAAERMSWAAFRETTRIEDMSYCLLGVFKVNMPLLYGEGQKSFIRLQEEIVKASEDYTLFAWPIEGPSSLSVPSDERLTCKGIMAESTKEFRIGTGSDWTYSNLQLSDPARFKDRGRDFRSQGTTVLNAPPVWTNRGCQMHVPLLGDNVDGIHSAYLYCRVVPDKLLVCIFLVRAQYGHENLWERTFSHNAGLHLVSRKNLKDFQTQLIYVHRGDQSDHYRRSKQEMKYSSAFFYIEEKALKGQDLSVHPASLSSLKRSSVSSNVILETRLISSVESDKLLFNYWGTTDKFMVRFGHQNSLPWCEIGDSENHGAKSDRATGHLDSGLANVHVKVRRSLIQKLSSTDRYLLEVSLC